MRVYTKVRNMLATHKDLLTKFEKLEKKLADHDDKIMLLLEYIKQFELHKNQELEQKSRPKIGYRKNE